MRTSFFEREQIEHILVHLPGAIREPFISGHSAEFGVRSMSTMLWISAALLAGLMPNPQLPARAEVTAPCSAEDTSLLSPAIGLGRTVLPRVRKEVVTAGDEVAGSVVVSVIVDTDGSVCDIRVVRSSPTGSSLEEAGIASAKQWKFAPATRDGIAIRAPVSIEFTFSAYEAIPGRPGQRGRTANAEVQGADPRVPDSRYRTRQATPRGGML